MSLELSCFTLYPCITLCPWNSPLLLYTSVLPYVPGTLLYYFIPLYYSYVPETLLYYFIPLYYLMSLELSCITLYPCITLCPWNSPTNCFSWLSQTLTLGRWPHSPVTRYLPSSLLNNTILSTRLGTWRCPGESLYFPLFTYPFVGNYEFSYFSRLKLQ